MALYSYMYVIDAGKHQSTCDSDAMATGDVHNNLRRLERALRMVHYGSELDTKRARDGDPTAFLPLIHYALLVYSHPFSVHLADRGYDLYAKSDLRFMEGVYKVLRDELQYIPRINKQQFFQQGFAEQKMIMVVEIIDSVVERHRELMRESKLGLRRLSVNKRAYVEQLLTLGSNTSFSEKKYDSQVYSPQSPPIASTARTQYVSFKDTVSFVSDHSLTPPHDMSHKAASVHNASLENSTSFIEPNMSNSNHNYSSNVDQHLNQAHPLGSTNKISHDNRESRDNFRHDPHTTHMKQINDDDQCISDTNTNFFAKSEQNSMQLMQYQHERRDHEHQQSTSSDSVLQKLTKRIENLSSRLEYIGERQARVDHEKGSRISETVGLVTQKQDYPVRNIKNLEQIQGNQTLSEVLDRLHACEVNLESLRVDISSKIVVLESRVSMLERVRVNHQVSPENIPKETQKLQQQQFHEGSTEHPHPPHSEYSGFPQQIAPGTNKANINIDTTTEFEPSFHNYFHHMSNHQQAFHKTTAEHSIREHPPAKFASTSVPNTSISAIQTAAASIIPTTNDGHIQNLNYIDSAGKGYMFARTEFTSNTNSSQSNEQKPFQHNSENPSQFLREQMKPSPIISQGNPHKKDTENFHGFKDDTAWEQLFKDAYQAPTGQYMQNNSVPFSKTSAADNPLRGDDAVAATPPCSPYRLFNPISTSSPKRNPTLRRTAMTLPQ